MENLISIKERLIGVMEYGDEVCITNKRLIRENNLELEHRVWERCSIKTDNSLVLARFGELYAAYAFECMGYEIAWPEIDDHGIDFIAIGKDKQLRIQVKTVREGNYTFIKEKNIDKMDYVAHIRVDKQKDEPSLFVFPVHLIKKAKLNPTGKRWMFYYRREYKEPEYGFSVDKRFFIDSEYMIGEKGTWDFERKELPGIDTI